MDQDALRIPKTMQRAELWVHPGNHVAGSIYLHLQSNRHAGRERPEEILNQPEPFLVFSCETPDELRFYSKRRIIRVQYRDDQHAAAPADTATLECRLCLTDGATLSGSINEFLPPGHGRLVDYLNNVAETFVRLHLGDGIVCLINKHYIVYASADRHAAV